jgi:uncharacterized RDD family membrane protein YckC
MHYAGFWRRLAAYLLDVVIIVLVVAGVFSVFFGFDETLRLYLEDRSPTNRLRFLAERNQIRDVSFLVWLIYSMVLEGSPLCGTLGKYLCGIKVVDRHGYPISEARSVGRNAAKLLSYIPLCLGFIWAAFSKEKQAWHDKIAETFVVSRRMHGPGDEILRQAQARKAKEDYEKRNPDKPYDGYTIEETLCENVITANRGAFTYKVYAHRYLSADELKEIVWKALKEGRIKEPGPGGTTTYVVRGIGDV